MLPTTDIQIPINTFDCVNHSNDSIRCIKPPIYECIIGSIPDSFFFYEEHKTGLPYSVLTSFTERVERMIMDRFWNIKEDDLVMDVGASYGMYTIRALLMGAKHVYAIDPVLEFLRSLQITLKLNRLIDRASLVTDAFWSTETVVDFDDRLYMTTSIHGPIIATGKVRTVALDTFAEKRNISGLDFLKIDVEGAELYVIQGGAKTIRKFKPKMIVELHGSANDKHDTAKKFLDILQYYILKDDLLVDVTFLFIDRLYAIVDFDPPPDRPTLTSS